MSEAAANAMAGAGAAQVPPTLLERHALHEGFVARRRLASWFAATAAILALLVLPPLLGSAYGLGRYAVAVAYAISAIGLGFAFGFAGELVLGHAAIMAVGAYTAGMLGVHAGWSGIAAAPTAIVVATAFGFVLMLPGIRVRGWYLALVSLFCVMAVGAVVQLAEPWTGGENGLSGIPRFNAGGYVFPDWLTYTMAIACLALTWIASVNIANSQWNVQLKICRDAPHAARAGGIDLEATRLVVYLLCAIPPAIAGTLLAYIERFANTGSFGIGLALLLLAAIVLGGVGSVWGPIVGIGILIGFSFWVGPFSNYNAIFLGLVLLISTLAFPDGLAPVIRRFSDRQLKRWPVRPAAAPQLPAAGLDMLSRSSTGTASQAILEVTGATKRFGGLHVLQGIDLTVRPGSFCGLVGPNGSGKSTLLNAISGAIVCDGGKVMLAGQDVTAWPMHLRARLGVGRTFQTPQLVAEATVLENIAVGAALKPAGIFGALLRSRRSRASKEEATLRALAIYEAVGLPPEMVAEPASSLPLGLKRIVEIGRALMSDPALLLLDEPAVGLNERERKRLGLLLRRLNERGIAIFLVEHNVGFVSEFCSELILLEAGEVTARADMKQALPPRLKAYLDHSPDMAPAAHAEPGEAE